MTFPEALAYLDSFVNYERAPRKAAERGALDLSRVVELSQRLGDPHRAYPVLHVAGSKGKGSICAFAAAILQAAGLRTGLFTSPHLVDVRERIALDGEPVPRDDFARIMSGMQPHLEALRARSDANRRPTYFEIMTHMGFLYFKDAKADAAVVEVGMGGRLDATNIVAPAVTAISTISLEHTAILGGTLALIAREKAGILKPGVACVSSPQPPEAAAAIEKAARSAGAPVEFVGREVVLEILGEEPGAAGVLPGVRARVKAPDGFDAEAVLGLPGRFQAENWAVAVRLAERFHRAQFGKPLPGEAIRTGSRNVRWPGRLEELPRREGGPRVFLDGAHTAGSVELVLAELARLLPGTQPRVVLFACAKDKNAEGMLRAASKHADAIVFTHSGNPRGILPQDLAAEWKRLCGREAPSIRGVDKALAEAERLAGPAGWVLATGSLYLVGAVKALAVDRKRCS